MPVYNFKKIAPVPTADAFIDIVLTRTQRRTPTVVHPGYKIQRIRAFYMRKVKFTQQTASERLAAIMTETFRFLRDRKKLVSVVHRLVRDRIQASESDLVGCQILLRVVLHHDALRRERCSLAARCLHLDATVGGVTDDGTRAPHIGRRRVERRRVRRERRRRARAGDGCVPLGWGATALRPPPPPLVAAAAAELGLGL